MPHWLKPSARLDLALVLARTRPVLRTDLRAPADLNAITKFARRYGLFAAMDRDGFVALSRRPGLGRRLLAIDATPDEHVVLLGRLLGYPPCCCRAARRVGEGELDAWAAQPRRHIGNFKLIDPVGYGDGDGLISHIPCSAACHASLKIARRLAASKWSPGRRFSIAARLRRGRRACRRLS